MRRRTWIILGALVLFGLPIAWYLASPLFIDREVDEAFPTLAPEATQTMSAAAAEADTMMEEPMPVTDEATMTVLARGEFYDLGGHPGMGIATVYELADNSRVLRFENFEVLNGPQLHVWLVPPDPVPDTVGREIQGYFDAGPLKGNIGDQNYELPADLDLDEYGSVVIWCVPFRVPFNAASLTPP
jgi:hypothetical protein